MNDRLLRLAAAVITGGFITVNLDRDVRIFLAAFFLLLLLRIWFLWKPSDFVGRYVRPEVILLACSVLAGALYGFTGDRLLAEPLVIEEIQLEGKLTDWVSGDIGGRGVFRTEAGLKYTLRVYPDYSGEWKKGWREVQPGDLITFTGRLEHPRPPGTEGELDLPVYNAVRGLEGTVTARSELMVLAEGEPGITWMIRQRARTVIDDVWPEQAGTLEGILFGDTGRIPPSALDMYKATGVMHVFAASGANVGFVMALAWGCFFFLPKKFRIFASLGVIFLYASLCQGNPPILRATILGAAVLLGMLGKGGLSGLRWLLFAALILFVLNPLYLRDISFQLSFAAAWGMLALSPRLKESRLILKLPRLLRQPASITFGAQIAVLPLLADVFHRVSLVGFVTNLFLLFLLGAALQLGLIGTVLLPVPVLSLIFYQAAVWLLQVTDWVLGLIAAFPWGYFWVLNPGMPFWVLWYSTIAVLLLGKDKVWFVLKVQLRKIVRLLSTMTGSARICFPNIHLQNIHFGKELQFFSGNKSKCLLLILLLLFLLRPSSFGGEKLEITFLDVGQGDCIIVETPSEKLIVDGGPRSATFDAGERIVVPYLMEKRIDYLDIAFITHEDSDHLGGMKYVLANIPVGKVVIPQAGERLENEEWQDGLPAGVWQDGESLVKLGAGDVLTFSSGLRVEVLGPVSAGGDQDDSNNTSLVLMLHFLGREVLLTGDMALDEMEQIYYRGDGWDADFIKLPHHGSKGSLDPSWFEQTYPDAVFIQVGKNSFGHPSEEVLEYWRERNIPVYRTDIQGTVRLVIGPKGYNIFAGRGGGR